MIDSGVLQREKELRERLRERLRTNESPYRTFDTGATRDLEDNKLDYEAFLSPACIHAYAEYMHGKRTMPDGTVRGGDNWQKGIPKDAYMKSAWRHFADWWMHHRGMGELSTEDLHTSLCALLFNVFGYMHETLNDDNNLS